MQYTTPSRYEDIGHSRGGKGQERVPLTGIQRGPLALMSLGTFMMIVWLVMLLPGQDIAAWQREQWLTQAANDFVDPTICLPRLAPETPVTIPNMRRGLFYHWRSDCPVLSPRWRSSHAPLSTMTFAQAQRRHLYPCGFCNRLEPSDVTPSP